MKDRTITRLAWQIIKQRPDVKFFLLTKRPERVAMKEAGIDYVYQSIYEITHTCLLRLLGVL